MTDPLFQATTRQDLLDDLAEALPLETWIGPFNVAGEAENVDHIYGGPEVDLKGSAFHEWFFTIVWMDRYQSGLKDGLPDLIPVAVPETMVERGLHANIRVGGERAEEIQQLIDDHFASQTKSARDWADDRVRTARNKPAGETLPKTARGTFWLQGNDPAGDGYVEHQSFIFA